MPNTEEVSNLIDEKANEIESTYARNLSPRMAKEDCKQILLDMYIAGAKRVLNELSSSCRQLETSEILL